MPGTVIPLRRGETLPKGQTPLSEADTRRITQHGMELIRQGRASAVHRIVGSTGNEVVVVLDNDGVIEFGIEKTSDGYLCFDCDCETIAEDTQLEPLLERFV